jgi:hypothetical protein
MPFCPKRSCDDVGPFYSRAMIFELLSEAQVLSAIGVWSHTTTKSRFSLPSPAQRHFSVSQVFSPVRS